jgi:hypothetical protein
MCMVRERERRGGGGGREADTHAFANSISKSHTLHIAYLNLDMYRVHILIYLGTCELRCDLHQYIIVEMQRARPALQPCAGWPSRARDQLVCCPSARMPPQSRPLGSAMPVAAVLGTAASCPFRFFCFSFPSVDSQCHRRTL